jgi:CheY-like chemotaxis protein
MTGPGEVTARVLERHVAERLDGVEPVEAGHYVVIEVKDTGCGISEQDLPHILEPFFSSKSESPRGGTGLGLAIAHQVVRQSGGYVHVRSRVGVGTTLALYFPLVTDEVGVESEPPMPAVGGSERVLVVDDEQVQLRTAQRLLKQLGYQVWTASSGAAAIELFDRHLEQEPFELVILDVMMPGALNGLDTLRALRKRNERQKALLASGYAPEQLERNAAELSTRWLAKPYTREALASAVRSALESSV